MNAEFISTTGIEQEDTVLDIRVTNELSYSHPDHLEQWCRHRIRITAPLTQLLRMDPRFQLADEDKLAAVFVARKNLSSAAAATPAAVGGVAHDAVK